MYRSKSFSSLFEMSQFDFANSPYMIFSQDSDAEPISEPEVQSQPYNPNWNAPAEEDESNSSSEEPPPAIQHAENNEDIIFTETAEVRSVLATLSNYKKGQLGTHLKSSCGLIILPLDAVTALRTPNGNHCLTYPCVVFFPHQELNHYADELPNFLESIQVLYKDKL